MAASDVPVKVYKSERRVTVAAAMPGLEPQDISINMSDSGELTLSADERGSFKGTNEVIMDEWNPGAYHRSIAISETVDASAADASYENGVLVISLPMSSSFKGGKVSLERISATEGKRNA